MQVQDHSDPRYHHVAWKFDHQDLKCWKESTNINQWFLQTFNPPQVLLSTRYFSSPELIQKSWMFRDLKTTQLMWGFAIFPLKGSILLSQPVLSPKWRGRASKRSTSSLAASSCRKAIKPLRPPPTMMTSYIAIRQEKTKKNQSHRSCSKILKLASSSWIWRDLNRCVCFCLFILPTKCRNFVNGKGKIQVFLITKVFFLHWRLNMIWQSNLEDQKHIDHTWCLDLNMEPISCQQGEVAFGWPCPLFGPKKAMLQSKTSTAVVVTFAPEKIDGWKLEDYIYI